jgi:hypothetical protein
MENILWFHVINGYVTAPVPLEELFASQSLGEIAKHMKRHPRISIRNSRKYSKKPSGLARHDRQADTR